MKSKIKPIYFNNLFSIFLAFSAIAQSVYADEGQNQEEIEEQTESINSVTLSTLEEGMFTRDGIYEKALLLFEQIKTHDNERVLCNDLPVSSLGESRQIIQCLGYEILNGRSDLRTCTDSLTGKKAIVFYMAEETIKQHEEATVYINQIWSEIEPYISSLSTEEEKATQIALKIVDVYITDYDRTYKNYAISDMIENNNYKGTCYTFTLLFDRLCEKAGIASYVEVGYKGSDNLHCWNKLVFSDGSIHYYDLAFYRYNRNSSYLNMSSSKYSNYSLLPYLPEEGYYTGIATIGMD